jgi:hypothetical protein
MLLWVWVVLWGLWHHVLWHQVLLLLLLLLHVGLRMLLLQVRRGWWWWHTKVRHTNPMTHPLVVCGDPTAAAAVVGAAMRTFRASGRVVMACRLPGGP